MLLLVIANKSSKNRKKTNVTPLPMTFIFVASLLKVSLLSLFFQFLISCSLFVSLRLIPQSCHLIFVIFFYLEFFKSSGINSGWNTNKSLPYVVWQNPEQMLRQVNQSWAEMINCQISSKNVQIKINKNVAFQLLTFEF